MRKSLYDCMAHIVRELLEETEESFYERYPALSAVESRQVNEKLSKLFPEIMEGGNPKAILTPYMSETGMLEKIEYVVDECKKTGDMVLLVRLLQKLDMALENRIQNEKVDSDEIWGLNSNSEEVGVQLLPRCFSYWGHKHKDNNSSNTLNNFLNNLYYIDIRKLKKETGCTVSHRIMSIDNFEQALKRGYLQVALCPFDDEARPEKEFEEANDRIKYNNFQIVAVSNEDTLIETITHLLKLARKKGVDIMCFPEVLGTQRVIEHLKELLEEFPSEEEGQYPVLIFCPTKWEDRKNNALVLNWRGEELFEQNKQFAFPLKEGEQTYLEGFERNAHIQVLHCDGIGRIGIMICKDAINRNYLHAILDILKITLLVVPSYSTGYHDFEVNLKECEAFDCNVVWTNACGAVSSTLRRPEDTLGFVLKTGKKTDIPNGMYCMKRESCMKLSGGSCRECLYIQKMYFGGIGCK